MLKGTFQSVFLSPACRTLYSGPLNGFVPQNICSLGQFLLSGRFGKKMSLERKCWWEKDNPTEGLNFAPLTTPQLASNVWTYVCWETSQ